MLKSHYAVCGENATRVRRGGASHPGKSDIAKCSPSLQNRALSLPRDEVWLGLSFYVYFIALSHKLQIQLQIHFNVGRAQLERTSSSFPRSYNAVTSRGEYENLAESTANLRELTERLFNVIRLARAARRFHLRDMIYASNYVTIKCLRAIASAFNKCSVIHITRRFAKGDRLVTRNVT